MIYNNDLILRRSQKLPDNKFGRVQESQDFLTPGFQSFVNSPNLSSYENSNRVSVVKRTMQ